MNILRWKRKSKRKIRFKTFILVIFSLIMTTFAWFAYSKVLNSSLNIHVASWDMEYYIGSVEQTNPIGISIPTMYPTMDEYSVTIDIKNNGEKKVDIEYEVKSVTIAGISFELIQEGETNTSGNYIILTPASFVTDTTTGEEIAKGAITNDLTKFPFTILIEHSAQVVPGNQGYLTVTVNWVGDQNELDSEWGYIVGEYLTNNPTATSVMSIELSIDSYQAEDVATEIVQTLPSTSETSPYLPTGCTRVPGTTFETGIVITDSKGNEYVWVEVPKSSTVYGSDGLGITEFTETECATIESKLKAYASEYNTSDDTYTVYEATGLTSDVVYNQLKQKMLKSIYQYGGFYIGRYETGISQSQSPRTSYSTSTPSQTPIIQANAYPFNYVNGRQAQALSSSLAPSADYTTSLMFGIQWDLVLKYLETKGAVDGVNDLKVDSTTWGNYLNNEYDIVNSNAKYLLTGSTWVTTPYSKTEGKETIITTGGNNNLFKQNIYDFAGNMSEWTLNFTYSDGSPVGGNGGDYTLEGTSSANNHGLYKGTTGHKNVGFRVTLFSNI